MTSQRFYHQTASAIAYYWMQELKIQPNVHFRVREATNGPRVLTLHVVINPRYASKIMGMAEQLSMATGLDKEQAIRIARGRAGALSIEIPKPGGIDSNGNTWGLWYNFRITSLPRRRGLKATVGLDNEHRPTLINFSNPITPHALIAGTTGSGKTNAQRLLIYDLASQNDPGQVQFVLIDTRKRGVNWGPFERLPHLAHPIVTDDRTALRLLTWGIAEIDRRAKDKRTMPHIFICLDETQALLEQEQFIKPISDIAAVGREFGIHLLAALQNPTKQHLGDTTIKRNLTTRLVGKTDDATSAYVATGQKDSKAERLMGAGDFLLIQPDGVKRLTTALLREDDIGHLPRGECVGHLDLEQYEDVDHVIDVADVGRADPVEPDHVALALATNRGITWLAGELSIGAAKARRIKEFADRVRIRLSELGYTTIPVIPDGEKTPTEGAE